MRLIGLDREEEAEEWARKRLGLDSAPSFFRAISAVDDNNEFVCVVVMTNFSGSNVDLNIAMECKKMRPKATLQMFNHVFKFIFEQLHITRVTALTNDKNEKAQNIIERFGFKLEGIMRKAAVSGNNLMIYGFLADDFYNHAWRRS